MSKLIRLSLAELSVIAAKLCAHSPASNNTAGSDQEYAEAGRVLLLQLCRPVDAVCKAVALEAGLGEALKHQPLWEALDGNLLWELEQKSKETIDQDWW